MFWNSDSPQHVQLGAFFVFEDAVSLPRLCLFETIMPTMLCCFVRVYFWDV
jgi:hypothetical protein